MGKVKRVLSEERKAKMRAYEHNRWINDKEYRDRRTRQIRAYQKAHPEVVAKNQIQTAKWRKNNREEYNKRMRKYQRKRLGLKPSKKYKDELYG